MRRLAPCSTALLLLLPSIAAAETYRVGPDKPYASLQEVADLLQPGDVVEVDGGQTYPGGVAFYNDGEVGNPITIRGLAVDGQRPVLEGGGNTIEAAGDHYVFEGLDITAGSNRCFFHHADDVVLRDAVVHDCPAQGILGADADSGSLLLEYVEVHHCGEGTQNHQIYMATDETAHPGAVFRMQFCWVHDANGGNNVKSRAERNEIYANWIEGALYHELELIGPDGQDEDLAVENGDVVGNVLVKTESSFVTRLGGDGTGQTFGHYRFVNNTVVVQPGGAAVFRLFDGIASLQAHDNVLVTTDFSPVTVVRDAEANWADGPAIFGSHNWVTTDSPVPESWTDTALGDDPGFTDLASLDLRPREDSPLVDAGLANPPSPDAYPFPTPLGVPQFHPPARALLEVGTAEPRPTVEALDLGAFEWGMAPPPGGETDGGSSGGGDESGEGSGDPATSGGGSSAGSGGETGGTSPTTAAPDTDTTAAQADEGGDGCSCRARSDAHGGWALALLGLLALRRRYPR